MRRTGFYPRPYPVCNGDGGHYQASTNGPEFVACGGCTACVHIPSQPPATPAEADAMAARGLASLERIMAECGTADEGAF